MDHDETKTPLAVMRNDAFPLQPVRASYKSLVIVLAQMQDQGKWPSTC